ncbi:retroviral-like aspartic protease family protein [Sphingomonas sp. RS6]
MVGVFHLLGYALLPLGLTTSTPDPQAIAAAKQPIPEIDLLLSESSARLTVPVAVGTNGPYPFIIDTGAQRTVVSRELAGALALVAGKPIMLTSMTGTSIVPTVIVPDLAIQSIGKSHRVIAPSLAASDLGAAGLLGIDTLGDHQVTIDLDAGIMTVRPSEARKRREKRDRDEIIVVAKDVFGQLIVTDAYYRNIRIQVVLDTGSQVTMGNSALRRRIGNRLGKVQPIRLTSVTGDTATADYTTVPDLRVGPIMFGSMPVAFADVEPFKRFGLTKRPALLLGMDAMRSFRRVEIDFANREVRFLVPRDTPSHGPDWRAPLIPGSQGASSTKTL